MLIRALAIILLCLAISSASANFAIFQVGKPLVPAAVTCNATAGTCTGTGAFTFTAATCDGNASHDDAAAFSSFNSAALTWQGSHSGLIELDIPNGSTCMFIGVGNCANGSSCPGDGIKQFRIIGLGYSGQGDGATFSDNGGAGRGFFLGAFRGVYQDNAHSARLQSSNVGDTCVTLVTSSQSSLFTVGNIALLSGFDMQQGGFPPNPYFYEWPKIASIDASHKCDGVTSGASVTFTGPLVNKYLSTWPIYNAGSGSEVDQGGPATLYAMNSAWDTDQTYIGLTLDQSTNNTYAIGRNITYQNVKFTGGLCGTPTQNENYTVTNSNFTSCDMEVDKINGTITLNGVTINQINFQSSSVNQFTLTNSTVVSSQQGTPKKFSCSGSTINGFQLGAHAYGFTSEVDIGNCDVTNMASVAVTDKGNGEGLGGTSNPGFNFTRSMSSGIISAANAVLITNAVNNGSGSWRITVSCQSIYPSCSDATTAFTVGQYYEMSLVCMSDNPGCAISGDKAGNYKVTAKNSGAQTIDLAFSFGSYTYTSGGQIASAVMKWDVPGANLTWNGQFNQEAVFWQVQTVTQDSYFTYVQTSLAGGFPTIPTYSSPAGSAIGASVHPAPVFKCSGCSGDVNAIAFGLDPAHGPYGSYFQRTFTAATTTPLVPVFGNLSSVEANITAANSGGGSPTFNLGGPFIVNSAGSAVVWNPAANANVTGDRKTTLSGVTCNGSAGACSGDTNLTAPDSTLTFLTDNQITGEYTGTCTGCSTTLTIQTTQGVVYPPQYP